MLAFSSASYVHCIGVKGPETNAYPTGELTEIVLTAPKHFDLQFRAPRQTTTAIYEIDVAGFELRI